MRFVTFRESQRKAPRAFTIVELLTVIAIIVLLVAILIPTIGGARSRGRATQTQALMARIGQSIDSYYGLFNAYPGPIPTFSTSSSTANVDSKVISGSQNLLLGLSYAMTTVSGPTSVLIPGANVYGAQAYADPARFSGPINYAAQQPNGSYEQISPYFSPTAQQLSPPTLPNAWPPGGVANAAVPPSGFAFPVPIDTFPEGLPILYYRRTPGVDGSQSPALAGDYGVSPSPPYPYYLDENREYTLSANLVSTDGTTFDQVRGGVNALNPAKFQVFVQNSGGTSARGGYLLMSAGIDRLYGAVSHAGITDNITVLGGN